MMLDRSRLASHLQAFPKQSIPVASLRPAAVLIPLYQRNGLDYLLFTEHTAHLEHHAGEISFPGGGYDHGDKDLSATALRETEEELGIARSQVEVLGRLDDFYSVHGYHVVPFVGTIPLPDNLQHDPLKLPAPSRPRWIIFETRQLIGLKTGNTSAVGIRSTSMSSKSTPSGA